MISVEKEKKRKETKLLSRRGTSFRKELCRGTSVVVARRAAHPLFLSPTDTYVRVTVCKDGGHHASSSAAVARLRSRLYRQQKKKKRKKEGQAESTRERAALPSRLPAPSHTIQSYEESEKVAAFCSIRVVTPGDEIENVEKR